MTIKQVDSAIRFAEKIKTLTERYDFCIKECSNFKTLWQSEKDARAKDKINYQEIIDGYAANIELLQKKYIGQVRKNRMLFILSIGALGFGLYQIIK